MHSCTKTLLYDLFIFDLFFHEESPFAPLYQRLPNALYKAGVSKRKRSDVRTSKYPYVRFHGSSSVSWRIFAPAVRTPLQAKRNRPWGVQGSFHSRPTGTALCLSARRELRLPCVNMSARIFRSRFRWFTRDRYFYRSRPRVVSHKAYLPTRDAPRAVLSRFTSRFSTLRCASLRQTSGFAFRRTATRTDEEAFLFFLTGFRRCSNRI